MFTTNHAALWIAVQHGTHYAVILCITLKRIKNPFLCMYECRHLCCSYTSTFCNMCTYRYQASIMKCVFKSTLYYVYSTKRYIQFLLLNFLWKKIFRNLSSALLSCPKFVVVITTLWQLIIQALLHWPGFCSRLQAICFLYSCTASAVVSTCVDSSVMKFSANWNRLFLSTFT